VEKNGPMTFAVDTLTYVLHVLTNRIHTYKHTKSLLQKSPNVS